MSECFTQIPDKRAELWRHRSCLSIDRYQWRCPGAFPIGQDAHKLARAKVIFDIPSTESDYSASGHAGFTERINALEQQLWNEFYLLSHLRFDERPFVLKIAFQGDMGDARVPQKISRDSRGSSAIKVLG
jgi:hypothetical protein